MTVISASSLLFEWFGEHDHLCLEDDFMKLVPISDTPEADKASLQASLQDLCQHEMLSMSLVGDKIYHVLKKPLNSYDQSVEIDFPTANLIAETLNNLCHRLDGFAESADPMNVKAKDLRNLAGIVGALMPDDDNDSSDIVV